MRELEPEEAVKLIDELTSAKCHNCARITALLEDRHGIAKALFDERNACFGVESNEREWELSQDIYLALADRLIAYLKPPLG